MTLMASGLGGFGLYTEIKGTSACKYKIQWILNIRYTLKSATFYLVSSEA